MMMKSQKRMKISASINDLPEVILLHIISFIPFIDAVKTSAIARSWRNLWYSIPTLNFNIQTFRSKMLLKSTQEVNELFSDFISDTLRHRPDHLSLHNFKLVLCEDTHNRFGSWLRLVIAAKVFELDLCFFPLCSYPNMMFLWEVNPRYRVLNNPFSFDPKLFFDLVDSSVEVLKLKGPQFRFPAVSLRLESIREVKLKRFSSTDREIADFIASCVHLERLSLSRGSGLKNLKIVSQQLKYLKLHRFSGDREFSVEICAPSLISFNLFDVYVAKFAMTRSSSLVEVKVELLANVMSCLTGVERLTIQNMRPYNYASQLQPEGVFHNLKHLELWITFTSDDVLSLESLLKQCPQLTTMVLVNIDTHGPNLTNYFFPKAMPKVIFQVPCLSLVEIKAFRMTKMVTHIVDLLKKHGVVLEKVVAYPHLVKGKSPLPPFEL